MKNLVEEHRGTEAVMPVDVLYVVFVEVVLVADIVAWLRCVRQWRRLRDHVTWLLCLGGGDLYLMAASLWVNTGRILSRPTVTVCDNWLTQHSAWLTQLPLVDATGIMCLIAIVLHRGRSLTREHVASMFVLASPWTIGLAVVLTLTLGMGIDPCICENFTYDRYMGFNASRFVYTLTVLVPIVSGLVVCFIMFCIRRNSPQNQNSMMNSFTGLNVTNDKKSHQIESCISNKPSDTVIVVSKEHYKIITETGSECTNKGEENEKNDLSNSDSKSASLGECYNPHFIQYNAHCKQHHNSPRYEQNTAPSDFHNANFALNTKQDLNQTTADSYSPGQSIADGYQPDTPNYVSGGITVFAFLYICLVIILPLTVFNISSVHPQLQETFSRHNVDTSKLYKDLCMWVYYLRTAVTPILWISYINA